MLSKKGNDQIQSTSKGVYSVSLTDSHITNHGGNLNITQKIVNNHNVEPQKYPVVLPYRHGLRSPIKTYHGREDVLKRIHDMLEDSSTSVLSQAITGLGGVGKTETAKKYAEEYGSHYSIILFIVAEAHDLLSKEIYEIAETFSVQIKTKIELVEKLKPLRNVIDQLYTCLSQYGKILIIFDNAENPKQFAADYLPMRPKELNGNVKILITSRWKKWNNVDYGDIGTLSLEVFSPKEAYDFVEKTLHDKKLFTDRDINELIKIVQYFPLALNQAVCYIREENNKLMCTNNRFTLEEYLILFKKQKDVILDVGQGDMYTLTVRSTWKVTMKKMMKTNGKCGKRAIEILKIIAFLSPDKIPFRKIFDMKNDDIDAILLLANYSVITIDEQKKHLSVHRLVQDVIKLDIKNKKDYIKKILKILSKNDVHYFRWKIDDHLYEVLKTAVVYKNTYSDLYKRFQSSPLTLITQRNDCEIDIIEKMAEFDLERKNYRAIYESFKNSIIKHNLEATKCLYKLLDRMNLIDGNIVLEFLFRNYDERNSEIAAFLLNEINRKNIKINPLDIITNFDYEMKNFESIWLIIDKFSWNYNKIDDYVNTSFTRACSWGWSDTVKILIDSKNIDFMHKTGKGNSALHLACVNKSEDIVNLLIDRFSWDYNDLNEYNETPFMLACSSGLTEIVKLMVNTQNCDVNLKNRFGNNILHVACKSDSLDTVNFLMEKFSWDYNDADDDGNTPFMKVCANGWTVIVKLMIESQECNVNVKNVYGENALHLACRRKSIDTVRLLIERFLWDVNDRNKDNETPFMVVCASNWTQIVQLMINRQNCDVNVKNNAGENALHIACKIEADNIVYILIKSFQWDFNVPDYLGNTPFMMACINQWLANIKLMTDIQKCDLNMKNNNGDNALHIACKFKSEDSVQFLLDSFSWDYNERNNNGETPFMLACKNGYFKIVKFMVDRQNCDVNVKNVNGENALQFACKSRSEDTFGLLVDRFTCDCDDPIYYGNTAFMVACVNGWTNVVKSMAENQKCNVGLKNKNGENALHLACKSTSKDTVLFLIEKYPWDYNECCEFYVTPLKIAESNNWTDIVTMMRNKSVK